MRWVLAKFKRECVITGQGVTYLQTALFGVMGLHSDRPLNEGSVSCQTILSAAHMLKAYKRNELSGID